MPGKKYQMTDIFAPKQEEFIQNSTKRWNLAHGSVRSGKTVCTLFRFLQACYKCPDSQIWMIGHTSSTIYDNAIRLIFECPQLEIYRPFCTWHTSTRKLSFFDKTISTTGAKDEGAAAVIQGKTMSLVYCDEMTLYPESIVDMINSRLSLSYSMGFASMNPSHPTHKIKHWIDQADQGSSRHYALHFTVEDNPYLPQAYIEDLKASSSGIFYKRNYLGLWCQAEGAVYEHFDRNTHVRERPPTAAEYWIAAIDYGTVNPFCCLVIGVNSGKHTQTKKQLWVEAEYYWDPKKKGRQKTNAEFTQDVKEFLEPYAIKTIYIDPSAEAFQLELRRQGLHVVHAKNDVIGGIQEVSSALFKGTLTILENCTNTIREMEGYVWDSKAAIKGYDEPLKVNDHSVDALRYAIFSHKVSTFDEQAYYKKQEQELKGKYHPGGYGFKPYG